MEPSAIKEKIQQDIVTAMRAKDSFKVGTLRLLTAAIKQKEIDEQVKLDNNGVFQILEKMIKQRQDAIQQFTAGNRPELADKEQKEIDLLSIYLPERLSDKELDALIAKAISDTQASSAKDMGKVMALLKTLVQGRADMTSVSVKVKERLQ